MVKRDELSTLNYRYMFDSKGMQISYMVQSFVTDVQMQKIILQDLDYNKLL